MAASDDNISEGTREYFVLSDFQQNLDGDFTASKRQYPDKQRMLSRKSISWKLADGEMHERSWRIYSVLAKESSLAIRADYYLAAPHC